MLQILLIGVLAILVIFVARQARLVARNGVDVHPGRSGRVFAAVFLGIALGVGVHLDDMRERSAGRRVFLESQAHRFDSFISKDHSIVPAVIIGVFVTGASIGVYELLAWGFSRAVKSAKKRSAT